MTAPLELTDHPAMRARVGRQTAVSAVALGVIFVLWAATLDTPPAVGAALAAGWALMPTVLAASLRRPRLRYALVVPAGLVSGALVLVCIVWPPDAAVARVGWRAIAAGALAGAGLGGWFWYRMLPVPAALQWPLSPGRWALIAGHVGLIVVGLLLVFLGEW